MKTVPSFVYRTAEALSIIGHPLLTIPLVTICMAFQHWPLKNAIAISALLLVGVVVPISWHNYQKLQLGQYTNFDVSNQQQRARFYPVLIVLVVLVAGLSFATHQPRPFCYGIACVVLLLVSSYGVNHYIKASLHTSLCFFLTWAIYANSPPLSLWMGVFSILVGISRLVLRRHTLIEILVGALIGLVAGISFYSITTLA